MKAVLVRYAAMPIEKRTKTCSYAMPYRPVGMKRAAKSPAPGCQVVMRAEPFPETRTAIIISRPLRHSPTIVPNANWVAHYMFVSNKHCIKVLGSCQWALPARNGEETVHPHVLEIISRFPLLGEFNQRFLSRSQGVYGFDPAFRYYPRAGTYLIIWAERLQ